MHKYNVIVRSHLRGITRLMHKGGANNSLDCVIMCELKASALSAIKTIIGLARVC